MTEEDQCYMRLALSQANLAACLGETPVGAVIVKNHRIVSAAFNRRELDKNALAHAEMIAIDYACRALGGWRLFGCTLYVTLEPCPMCAGAIINARIQRVVYGASDPKAGSLGSMVNLASFPYNHKPDVQGGLYAEESAGMLQQFFQQLRRRNH